MSEYGGVGEQVKDNTVAFGEIKWAKLPGNVWWPGQVVDENTVSKDKISGKKSSGKVLVRLYGTYNYSYIDPIKSQLEFDIILKQNNGSHNKIFQQSLEKDISVNKSCRLNGRGSKSKVARNARKDTSRGKNTGKISGVERASSSTPKKKLRVDSSSKARTKNVGQGVQANKAKPRQTGFENGVKINEENPRKKTLRRSELNNGSSLERAPLQKSEGKRGRRVKVMQNLDNYRGPRTLSFVSQVIQVRR